jgi:sporulation protein YlmC with PRC-barrel domain
MKNAAYSKLIKLGDTNLTLAQPADDIRGRKVVDKKGELIGHVDDLFIDDTQKRVRMLLIRHGGVFGLGGDKFLMPIDAVTKIDHDLVHIDRQREHLAGVPVYNPEMTPDEHYFTGIYGFWGFGPYWGTGYMYPTYPIYP